MEPGANRWLPIGSEVVRRPIREHLAWASGSFLQGKFSINHLGQAGNGRDGGGSDGVRLAGGRHQFVEWNALHLHKHRKGEIRAPRWSIWREPGGATSSSSVHWLERRAPPSTFPTELPYWVKFQQVFTMILVNLDRKVWQDR